MGFRVLASDLGFTGYMRICREQNAGHRLCGLVFYSEKYLEINRSRLFRGQAFGSGVLTETAGYSWEP